MNQCVPSWDLDDPNPPPRLRPDIQSHHNLLSGPAVHMSDFEVAELTWENGNILSHGLGAPRIIKAMPKYPTITNAPATVPSATGITWAKQRMSGGGTLEEVVNEATRGHMLPPALLPGTKFTPWTSTVHAAQAAVDLLVPCTRDDIETSMVVRKRARLVGEDGRVCASQGSAAPGRGESMLVTLDTCGGASAGEDMGFTTTTNNSTSLSLLDGEGGGSPDLTENASIGGGCANDSICQSERSKAIIQSYEQNFHLCHRHALHKFPIYMC
jgi:hypothetical protein